jgi:hypothetical protein
MNTGKFEGHHEAISIEEAVREYLRGEPRALRLLLERFCDAIDGEQAKKRSEIGAKRDYVRSRLRRLA